MRVWCRNTGRFAAFLAAVAGLGFWLAPGALAKFSMLLSLSSSKPQVGRPVHVLIRTGPVGSGVCQMRLIAIAPGAAWQRALDALVNGGMGVMGTNGTTFVRLRVTPKLGLRIPAHRANSTAWRATVRFPRTGKWELIVPNWCAPGWATPLPATRFVTVR
jgi:hypothetical protein